jgi:ribosome modulation factor
MKCDCEYCVARAVVYKGDRVADARGDGHAAYGRSQSREANPFRHEPEYTAWDDGWCEAQNVSEAARMGALRA